MKLISTQEAFNLEFERCCKVYHHLDIFTAWVGNPGNIVPYSHLDNLDTVNIYLGISFDQSHPDGIKFLITKKYKVVIIDTNNTYHPKLYFFKTKNKSALLLGSSNFTFCGFYENIEANILLEGKDFQRKIEIYLTEMKLMINGLKTFTPNGIWLEEYRKKYKARQEKLKQSKIKEESVKENAKISSASWLSKANWETYLKHIQKGINNHTVAYGESFENLVALFSEYSIKLKTPWTQKIFNTIDSRRRILGIKPYGWLGHIGASGEIRRLLSNGTLHEKRTVVNMINGITEMQIPLDYSLLKTNLENLEKLGLTIKVWGRMLAITRPDIYCTISSNYVRASLSELLAKPKSYFETTDGYIEFLKLTHQSPWYNAPKPKNKSEQKIWINRVAFLDVVFY